MDEVILMFNSKHYIPILKWKRAEQSALEALSVEEKQVITPVIQLVMPKLTAKESSGKNQDQLFKEVISKFQKKTKEIPEEILKAWGTMPVFLDFSFLYTTELKVEALKTILPKGEALGIFLIPVLHLSDDQKIVESVKNYKNGLCLRLVCPDLDAFSKLDEKIKRILAATDLNGKDIDLLIDIKEIGEDTEKFSKYINLSKNIPNLAKWRTFTFASGAFHKDMSKCKIDEDTLIPRTDWTSWIAQTKTGNLPRIPSFADYTIQYPIYEEATQFFPPTTTIKYALDEHWLILKGEKQKFELYLGNAKLLVDDGRFYGENFSFGDKFIFEKANHYEKYIKDPSIKGTGSTETWLTAGINHHLALVAHQISNLA